ncbi:G-box-binding factor 1-like isoform X1 [Cynara cardunculus var. scolymus]|uniref:G-box-binding factor 1-like isoform X1 n=2 Tax=Cynara cardunculus var. scolymus TaxID=59895 RepID=UPI000D62E1F1|nr:G-box-binding factor 1-like isoform X1 [Cynara cardunculus var. scolymus]XP_024995089.1 G-box-binding factor 1-like isoform X1 [Cynara cardunculus var. scolymus]
MQPNSFAASKTVVRPPMVRKETSRVLKREMRKQSNRESARRSRLRKQAECEELQARVAGLRNENLLLREELQRLSVECDKVANENMKMKDELCKSLGPEELLELDAFLESRFDEGNS